MASCVYFKMFHNRQSPDVETVSFSGNEIKLLELKRSIVEIKKFSQGMNFDLTILDAETPSRGRHLKHCRELPVFHQMWLCFALMIGVALLTKLLVCLISVVIIKSLLIRCCVYF